MIGDEICNRDVIIVHPNMAVYLAGPKLLFKRLC